MRKTIPACRGCQKPGCLNCEEEIIACDSCGKDVTEEVTKTVNFKEVQGDICKKCFIMYAASHHDEMFDLFGADMLLWLWEELSE